MDRSTLPPIRTLAVLLLLAGIACGSGQHEPGCVDASGSWTFSVSDTQSPGNVLSCDERLLAWTITQSGCSFAVAAPSWDPSNGATGTVIENRLHVEWSSSWECMRVSEWIDAVVDGGQMSGRYGFIRAPVVFPIPAGCAGSGSCTASLAAVRQTP